jgi:anthranilate phosphoribosyltransferase
MKEIFEQIIDRKDLTPLQMRNVMQQCLQDELSDVQIATFLSLMRMKGETVSELTVAAETFLSAARLIDLGVDAIDIVGTGGDGRNTFNVSTVSSFVVAAAGLPVAKHGNVSVSSRCGSADFLQQAGFNLNLDNQSLQKCMDELGLIFLFAPNFHSALKYARNARHQLGIRTCFNLLGPLLNPARVSYVTLGVYAKQWMLPLLKVLQNLGSKRAMVLHAQDGLDEVSISAPTDVVEVVGGEIKQWTIYPKDFNCYHSSLEPIVVNSIQESLKLADSVLHGETGPARDIVLLNSATALYCGEACSNFAQGIEVAKEVLDNGLAYSLYENLKKLTQRLHNE